MSAASSLWFRTRAGISRTATWLRSVAAELTGNLSRLFHVFMGHAVALSALCVLIDLAGELDSFLRAPLGFKDEALTGLPSLAEVVVLPALGSALVLWIIAKYLGSLSARWRWTEYYPETSEQPAPQDFSRASDGRTARERVRLEELARSRVRALGWGDGDSTLERAVETAIKEARASSLMQMGRVIKTARGLLWGERFDEKELRDVVRTRLLAKKRDEVDSAGQNR